MNATRASHGSVKVANGCFEQAGADEYVAEFARIRASAGSLATSATDFDGALPCVVPQ